MVILFSMAMLNNQMVKPLFSDKNILAGEHIIA